MSFDPFVLPITLAGVQPISGVITTAMANDANAHTLQALIETTYVTTGNQILSAGLDQLQTALDATQGSLGTLATLQQLHNNITVKSLSAFGFNFSSLPSINGVSEGPYQQSYLQWASAYFGTPILPNFIFESQAVAQLGSARGVFDNFADFSSQLAAAKSALSDNITSLRAITTVDASGNPTDPNSLLAKLIIVYKDMPPVVSGVVSYNNAKIWALDHYTAYQGVDLAQSGVYGDGSRVASGGFAQNPYLESAGGTLTPINIITSSYLGSATDRGDASRAGSFNQNLQFAITAAQSLNDSQKEQVRRFLFVFEEFYKSASTLLSAITQIIQKIAQGIRPA